jgi:hypothetical protein
MERVRAGEEYAAYASIELQILDACEQFNLDPDGVFFALHERAKHPLEESNEAYTEETIQEWAEASRKSAKNCFACLRCGEKFESVEEAAKHICLAELVTI